MGEKSNTHRILVGKSQVKRLTVRRKIRWNGNIKIDLTGIGLNCIDWIHLAQNRDRWRALVITETKFLLP
jgi:hypothetical protein